MLSYVVTTGSVAEIRIYFMGKRALLVEKYHVSSSSRKKDVNCYQGLAIAIAAAAATAATAAATATTGIIPRPAGFAAG